MRLKHGLVGAVAVAGLVSPPAAFVAACKTTSAATARAATASPQDVQAGISLYQQGKYAEAEAQLRGAEGAEAKAYLAGSLAKQKKYGEAEAAAGQALAANPTHEVAVAALGEALVGQKKYDDAIARLEAAVGKKGDLAYGFYWLGHAYYNKKQTDQMLRAFDRFLQLAPKAPEAPAVQQLLAGVR